MTARIAVLRALPGVGDLLCAVPALRALRAAHRDAEVTLIGLPSATWFVERFGPYVDRLLPLTAWPGLPEAPGPPDEACAFVCAARRHRFDVAFQMHGDGTVTNDLVARLGAGRMAGMLGPGGIAPVDGRFVEVTAETGEVARLLAVVRAAGIRTPSDALEWPERPAEGAAAEALVAGDGPYAVVHAGASLESRRWHPRGFAAVGDDLVRRGWHVVLTGVTAERRVADAVMATMESEVLDLVGRSSLGTTAAVVRRAALVVTNDTGMSHLAAAVGTRSVVVFSVTDPRRWKPAGDRHRAVIAGELHSTIAAVLAALPS